MLAADLPAVVEIDQQMPGPWNLNQWAAELQVAGADCLVGEVQGKVVAFAACRRVGQEAELMRIAVSRRFQRQKMGSLLLSAVCKRLAFHRITGCFLEVRAGNKAGQVLYSASGFRIIGRRPKYYRHPVEDAVLMRLDLELIDMNMI